MTFDFQSNQLPFNDVLSDIFEARTLEELDRSSPHLIGRLVGKYMVRSSVLIVLDTGGEACAHLICQQSIQRNQALRKHDIDKALIKLLGGVSGIFPAGEGMLELIDKSVNQGDSK